MNNDYSDIMKILLEIKGDVGGIKEHLKTINGSVQRHEVEIDNLKKFVYKAIGGLTIGLIVLQGILMSGGVA